MTSPATSGIYHSILDIQYDAYDDMMKMVSYFIYIFNILPYARQEHYLYYETMYYTRKLGN